MAKLENVKILDMVNGEVTRIEYKGAVYEKVNEEAQEGDLVRVIDDDGIGHVTQGGFYETYIDDDDLVFDDDDGDARTYEYYDTEFETFRKVSETKAITDLAEQIAELERRLEALEKHMSVKDESAPKFEVGDYVVPLPEADDEYNITNTDMKLGKVRDVYGDAEISIEVISHKDGDAIGSFYTVESKYFRKATDEEVAESKDLTRWAKIGRKPGEFKKGDIVCYTPYADRWCHGLKDYPGIITEVTDVSGGLIYVKKPEFVKSECGTWSVEIELELIVPVEQRFDKIETE
jgi:hypothetical protein